MSERRPLALAIKAICAVAALALLIPPASQASPPRTAQEFDFDTGNAAIEVVFPHAEPLIRQSVKVSDAPLVLRITTVMDHAWFDALAPYHPTAVGISSDLGRRPPAERETNRERNIALLYATYRAMLSLLPQHEDGWRAMLTDVGLDPDDDSTDLTPPVGIGNAAGYAVVEDRSHDGMNQLGDEGGRTYHRSPYADYTGYEPVNSPGELRDPSRWQPAVVTDGNGIFRAQEFVTPQWALTKPYSFDDPAGFTVPPPENSDYQNNPEGYRRQADAVLRAQAELTDYQKLVAEHFDNKFSLALSIVHLAQQNEYSLDEFVHNEFLTNMAAFDTGIAVWHNKVKYDAVRPFTAIRFLYADRELTAWGGPGKGTVSDLPGEEWNSYLATADHPEYPSASASFCAAHAEAMRQKTGTDELGDYSHTIEQGASLIEPGATPSRDTVLGPWRTWTEWENECGVSRFWGGVHFEDAVTNGQALGHRIGALAYDFLASHIAGTPR